jgi:hypothetical protein
MPAIALLELAITAIVAGLVCFLITSRIDERRWRKQLVESATWCFDARLDDAVTRWADQM